MKQYTVTVNGIDHTMQLDDKDAARYRKAGMLSEGSELDDLRKAVEDAGEGSGDEKAPEGSESKEDPKEGEGDTKEGTKPANKSTRAANKAG